MSGTERRDGLPGPARPRRPEDFDARYVGTPPWDIGRPQPTFVELADTIQGRILDVGCGTGEHALMAAAMGLDATGIDAAPAAIATAQRKAHDRGLSARFFVHNALDLASLDEHFDTVLDCGLFHIFEDDDRPVYVDNLRSVISPGGRYYMLCFSDREPGDRGPRRVTERELREQFRDGWRIDALDPTTIELTIDPHGAHAWAATITRT
jgi:ubiquinone/menaquinone biosynthesis C-methylase UbiE